MQTERTCCEGCKHNVVANAVTGWGFCKLHLIPTPIRADTDDCICTDYETEEGRTVNDQVLDLLLTPKQQIYYKEYRAGSTMTEISEKYGVNQSVVSRSLKAAKQRILRYMEDHKND